MGTHKKGDGKKTYRSLNDGQKYKLWGWANENKELIKNRTAVRIASVASEVLGFEIGEHTTAELKHNMFPETKRTPSKGNITNRIDEIEKRIAQIEKEFGIAAGDSDAA